MKFKIGDAVTVIAIHNGAPLRTIQQTGVIHSVYSRSEDTEGHYSVKFPGEKIEWCYMDQEIIRFVSPKSQALTLPIDSVERKNYPLFAGCLRYFPAALAGVAKTSKLGNDKHNPGEEMHHARGKSMDHGDCIIRHLLDTEDLLAAVARGETVKQDVLNEVNQMAWRALAFSQLVHEKFGAPLAPGAKTTAKTGKGKTE